MAVATTTALLITGLVGAGASTGVNLYAQHKAGEANDRARLDSLHANSDQLAYLKQKDTQDQTNFDKTFEEQRREWQETQDRNYALWQAREAQLAPYRANSLAANNTLAGLIGFHRSGGGDGGAPTSSAYLPSSASRGYTDEELGQASDMFLASMAKHRLDPVAVQGHGADIVAALKADYPNLDVHVDPKSDAVVWGKFGALDVTKDSGKGGFYFRPSGDSGGAPPPPSATPPRSSLADLIRPSTSTAPSMLTPAGSLSSLVRTDAPMVNPVDVNTLYALLNRLQQSPADNPIYRGDAFGSRFVTA